jgi:hypothetical protein
MKTAIDKNESELEKMKREALEWIERCKGAPPFISVAVNAFTSQRIDRREVRVSIVKWMCDENISRFCNPDKIVDEYLKTHPEPLEITDEMIEKEDKSISIDQYMNLNPDLEP